MTVEEPKRVDFSGLEPQSGEWLLVITDHLGWGEQEGEHLMALQDKLNFYLAFIESGEIYKKTPKAIGRKIVIRVMGKFPLSDEARKFYRLAEKAISDAGFSLRFEHLDQK